MCFTNQYVKIDQGSQVAPLIQFRLASRSHATLSELIGAGNYRYVDPSITSKRFPDPLPDFGSIDGVMMAGIGCRSSCILDAIARSGMRPGSLREMLHLGAIDENIGLRFSLVCLGSVWNRLALDRRVPCIEACSGGRKLSVRSLYSKWHLYPDMRFLAYQVMGTFHWSPRMAAG